MYILEDALELEERLVVERDVVEILCRDVPVVEAELDRVLREPRVMLPAGKALLLRGGQDFAVAHEVAALSW